MPSCKKLVLLKLLWIELIVIIFMKWTGYALLWIITSYRWLLSKTFWTIFLFGLLHVYILPFTFTACKIESYAPNNILGIIKDHDFSFSLSVHSTTTLGSIPLSYFHLKKPLHTFCTSKWLLVKQNLWRKISSHLKIMITNVMSVTNHFHLLKS